MFGVRSDCSSRSCLCVKSQFFSEADSSPATTALMDGAQNYYDLLAQNQHLSNTVREQQKKLRQISSFCEGIGNVLSDSVNNEQDVHSPSSYSIQSPKDIVQGTSGNTLNSLNSTHMHELDSQQSVTWNDQRTNGLVRPMVPRPSVFCLDLLRSEGAARLAYLTQSEQSPSSSIRYVHTIPGIAVVF